VANPAQKYAFLTKLRKEAITQAEIEAQKQSIGGGCVVM
jgi:hypothetical protein